MKNPGRLYDMQDGRFCIMYNDQPLLVSHSRFVFNLCDNQGNEYSPPKKLIKEKQEAFTTMMLWIQIGFID